MRIKQPLAPVLAFMGACTFSVAAIGADTPKLAEASGTSADPSGKPSFVVHNPDGTFTVRKEPAPGKTEGVGQKGLVIPPQVVVPELRAPVKDQRD
jgi:hypothetical protein